MEQYKEYIRPCDEGDWPSHDEDFGTIADIILWMAYHEVPLTAKIVYAGCGSHNIGFEWEDSKPEEHELAIFNDQTGE